MTLVALLLGLLALTVLRTTLNHQETLVSAYLTEVVRTEELVSVSNQAARKARDFLLTADEAHLRELEAARARFLALQDALEASHVRPEDRERLSRVRALWFTAGASANRAIQARQRTDKVVGETARIIQEEMLPDRARFDAELEALLRHERAHHEAAQREAEAAATRAWRLLAAGFLGAAVASLALGAILLRALRERAQVEAERAALLAREQEARQLAEQTQEELRRTAQFRERLIGIVSHDLRTPLSAISAGTSLLLRLEGIPEKALRTVGRISSSAERMAKMIEELLDFTRVRLGGGIPVQRTASDLYPVVRHAVEEAEMAFPDRGVRLEAHGDFRGEWDEGRLAQVVGNLLKNALTYSPEGTPVRLGLHDEGAWVRLEIHNQNRAGPIPPETLPLLFDPFRRGEASHTEGASEGLGLGLYIAREIVSAHHGFIDVMSSEPEGTVFTVRLPRAGTPERAERVP
ncbi:MAG TPA: ATP-binding protein [Archangium sp.]